MALRIDFKQVQAEFKACKDESELKDRLTHYKKLLDGEHITVRQYWAIQNFYARAVDSLRFGNRHLKAFDRVGKSGFRIKG